jgi:hypothetical protein
MTSTERASVWIGLLVASLAAAMLIRDEGLGHFAGMALTVASSVAALRLGEIAHDYLVGAKRELAELSEQAREISERTGLRIAVERRGRRFEAAIVRDDAPNRGSFVAITAPVSAPELRSWLYGIDAGNRLTREEL